MFRLLFIVALVLVLVQCRPDSLGDTASLGRIDQENNIQDPLVDIKEKLYRKYGHLFLNITIDLGDSHMVKAVQMDEKHYCIVLQSWGAENFKVTEQVITEQGALDKNQIRQAMNYSPYSFRAFFMAVGVLFAIVVNKDFKAGRIKQFTDALKNQVTPMSLMAAFIAFWKPGTLFLGLVEAVMGFVKGEDPAAVAAMSTFTLLPIPFNVFVLERGIREIRLKQLIEDKVNLATDENFIKFLNFLHTAKPAVPGGCDDLKRVLRQDF